MAELVIEKLTKRFGDNLVVDNINFTVPSEKFVTILGPSGCGKTTVLRCIVGVEKPDGGKMKLGDQVLFSKNENLFLRRPKSRLLQTVNHIFLEEMGLDLPG